MSSINENWVRWCHHSIVKHFYDILKDEGEWYVEGRMRPENETYPRYELRIDGPHFNEISNAYWYIDVEINIAILTVRDDKDMYQHQRLVGKATTCFTDDILVYQFGETDNPLLGCFREMTTSKFGEKIVVTNYGVIGATRITASTAEGHYRMCLKG